MKSFDKMRNMAAIYLSCGDELLLLFRQDSNVVNDVWIGSAGGHLEESEINNPKACVLRELYEELSLTEDVLSGLKLRYITLRRTNGEIRQNHYFFAELKDGLKRDFISNEGISKWFKYDEILKLKMPFSAKFMLEHYLETGIHNDKIYVGAADGEKVIFNELTDN